MRRGPYLEALEEKLAILGRICGNVRVDRSSIEECIRAVAMNAEEFQALVLLESRLEGLVGEEDEAVRAALKEAGAALKAAHEGTAALMDRIRMEKEAAARSVAEFSRIEAIRSSYLKGAAKPVFVDRDF